MIRESERSSTYSRNIFSKVRTLEPPLNADGDEWGEDHNSNEWSEGE